MTANLRLVRPGYRILVTGSRDWDNEQALRLALISAWTPHQETAVIIHGACPSGADAMAAEWARHYDVRAEPHPADWKAHGRQAGPRRNAEMVLLGAAVCLAFAMPCTDSRCDKPRPHDSHGTAHCADLAGKAGIRVRRYGPLSRGAGGIA